MRPLFRSLILRMTEVFQMSSFMSPGLIQPCLRMNSEIRKASRAGRRRCMKRIWMRTDAGDYPLCVMV